MRLDGGQPLALVRPSGHRSLDDDLSLADHLRRSTSGALFVRSADVRRRRAAPHYGTASQGLAKKLASLHVPGAPLAARCRPATGLFEDVVVALLLQFRRE